MKKTFLALLASLLLLVGCSSGNIMSGYKGFDKKDHHYVTQDFNKIVEDIENKVPGIYYLGFKECPWCIALVPVMEEALTNTNQKAVYINVKDSAWNADLSNRISEFEKTLPASVKKSNNSVPFVIIIQNDGTVNTHLGTVDNHDGQRALTEEEVKFLRVRLEASFENIEAKNLPQ